MRRILALALVLCMAAACFAGCGKSEESIRGSVTPEKKESQTEPKETVPVTTPDAVPETTPETTAGAEFSMGSTSGNQWENAFIGIGCKLDENWTFLSDEEILQQNQLSTDLVGEEYKEALESAAVVYDMMASHVDGMKNVSVNLEKLTGAALLINEETYVSVAVENAVGALESMGIENVQATTEEITFGGGNHYCVRIEGESSGNKLYETLVAIKCNGYIACITVATWIEDGTGEILGCFYGL